MNAERKKEETLYIHIYEIFFKKEARKSVFERLTGITNILVLTQFGIAPCGWGRGQRPEP
jgi:hypothetical protein